MNTATRREEEVFDAALKLGPAERGKFLDRACEGDPEMRGKVEELLASQAEAEEFFTECLTGLRTAASELHAHGEDGAPDDSFPLQPPEDEQLGASIGHYKILEKIGEGGCGAVYMAEQQEPVRRRVALKIIKLGMDTKAVINRFEAERQALALMEHPNIAKVFDAGATSTGRPYFVMELVHGVRITEYCDQNHLDTVQRLDLFIQICHAIQHAHQKGIIHRDIKPSNIVVSRQDGRPVPKVIDFGIAKATSDQRLTDNTIYTACDQFIGTPAYMSPEQAQSGGVDIDTRSDIYSLGVLLYELLTGKTPFDHKDLMKSGLDGMRRTLMEIDPHRPSTRLDTLRGDELTVTALRRHAEPPKLQSLLRGDLDWIVMKALEKDRAQRYETANGLAMDVQRHLNNEPVVARPRSRVYQFQKLVRRNKVVFAAAAAVTAALLIGLGTSTWLFLQERKALERAVKAEQQKARLLVEAEQARNTEAELRRQAEAREKFTKAAALVHESGYERAEDLIRKIDPAEPSLEHAAVFRSIGEWHALQGRWNQAADRFGDLLRVDQLDGWDVATFDLLERGAALIEAGERAEYEAFRHAAIEGLTDTTNAVAAERTLKVSLFLPADDQVMRALAPLAMVAASFCTNSALTDSETVFKAAWASISLALMEYRLGDYVKSSDWCRRSLACAQTNAPREATAHVILALASRRLGQADEARRELAQARELIEGHFRDPVDLGTPAGGFWFDWAFARILLREALAAA